MNLLCGSALAIVSVFGEDQDSLQAAADVEEVAALATALGKVEIGAATEHEQGSGSTTGYVGRVIDKVPVLPGAGVEAVYRD